MTVKELDTCLLNLIYGKSVIQIAPTIGGLYEYKSGDAELREWYNREVVAINIDDIDKNNHIKNCILVVR